MLKQKTLRIFLDSSFSHTHIPSISKSVGSVFKNIQYLTPSYHLYYKYSGLILIVIIVKVLKAKKDSFRQKASVVKGMNNVEIDIHKG